MGIREFYKGFENINVSPSKMVANLSILSLYAINLLFLRNPILYDVDNDSYCHELSFLFNIEHRELTDAMQL